MQQKKKKKEHEQKWTHWWRELSHGQNIGKNHGNQKSKIALSTVFKSLREYCSRKVTKSVAQWILEHSAANGFAWYIHGGKSEQNILDF